MNAKFQKESDKLKPAPEASLWKGIPTHLIAPNVAGLTDLNVNTGNPNNHAQATRNTRPSALFPEATHFMQRENHEQEDNPYPLSPRKRNFLQKILEKSRY